MRADLAERDGDRALVIATQADPWVNDIPAYRELIAHVGARRAAAAIAR